jgi:hypothetical protein
MFDPKVIARLKVSLQNLSSGRWRMPIVSHASFRSILTFYVLPSKPRFPKYFLLFKYSEQKFCTHFLFMPFVPHILSSWSFFFWPFWWTSAKTRTTMILLTPFWLSLTLCRNVPANLENQIHKNCFTKRLFQITSTYIVTDLRYHSALNTP